MHVSQQPKSKAQIPIVLKKNVPTYAVHIHNKYEIIKQRTNVKYVRLSISACAFKTYDV